MFPPAFVVGRYTARSLEDLEQKLLQYPHGTVFQWCAHGENPFDTFSAGQKTEMSQRLKQRLAAHGLMLEVPAGRCGSGPGA